MLCGYFGRQGKGDHFVGGDGAIRAADRTSYRKRHPAAERVDVECVPLTTTALNLDRYHKPQGLLVTGDSFAWIVPNEICLESWSFLRLTCNRTRAFHTQTRDFHAKRKKWESSFRNNSKSDTTGRLNVSAIPFSAVRAGPAPEGPCGNGPWRFLTGSLRPAPSQISSPPHPPHWKRPSAVPR